MSYSLDSASDAGSYYKGAGGARQPYDDLRAQFLQVAKHSDQGKAIKQLTQLLPDMCLHAHQVGRDASLIPALAKLISSDDRQLRYYMFFATMLLENGYSGSPLASKLAPLLDLFLKEAQATPSGSAENMRQLQAIRALAAYPGEDDAYRDRLVTTVTSFLEKLAAGTAGKRRKSLFSRNDNEKQALLRSHQEHAIHLLMRRRLSDRRLLLEQAVLGLGCGDVAGARHALALTVEYMRSEPERAASLLGPLMPQPSQLSSSLPSPGTGPSSASKSAAPSTSPTLAADKTTMDLYALWRCEDVRTRVLFYRLCSTALNAASLHAKPSLIAPFASLLTHGLRHDPHPRVAIECITGLLGAYGTVRADRRRALAHAWRRLEQGCLETAAPDGQLAPGGPLTPPISSSSSATPGAAVPSPSASATASGSAPGTSATGVQNKPVRRRDSRGGVRSPRGLEMAAIAEDNALAANTHPSLGGGSGRDYDTSGGDAILNGALASIVHRIVNDLLRTSSRPGLHAGVRMAALLGESHATYVAMIAEGNPALIAAVGGLNRGKTGAGATSVGSGRSRDSADGSQGGPGGSGSFRGDSSGNFGGDELVGALLGQGPASTTPAEVARIRQATLMSSAGAAGGLMGDGWEDGMNGGMGGGGGEGRENGGENGGMDGGATGGVDNDPGILGRSAIFRTAQLSPPQLVRLLAGVVKRIVVCECHYVRTAAIQALLWLQGEGQGALADDLMAVLASELRDPSWPRALLDELLLFIHFRLRATPSLSAVLLRAALCWPMLVPHITDPDVLARIWTEALENGSGTVGRCAVLESLLTIMDLANRSPPVLLGASASSASSSGSGAALSKSSSGADKSMTSATTPSRPQLAPDHAAMPESDPNGAPMGQVAGTDGANPAASVPQTPESVSAKEAMSSLSNAGAMAGAGKPSGPSALGVGGSGGGSATEALSVADAVLYLVRSAIQFMGNHVGQVTGGRVRDWANSEPVKRILKAKDGMRVSGGVANGTVVSMTSALGGGLGSGELLGGETGQGEALAKLGLAMHPAMSLLVSALQGCAVASHWTVRLVAVRALVKVALLAGEPFRVQCYAFLRSLLPGGPGGPGGAGLGSQVSGPGSAYAGNAVGGADGAILGGADAGGDDAFNSSGRMVLGSKGLSLGLPSLWGMSLGRPAFGGGLGVGLIAAEGVALLDRMYEGIAEVRRLVDFQATSRTMLTEVQLQSVRDLHSSLLADVQLWCPSLDSSSFLPLGPESAKLLNDGAMANLMDEGALSKMPSGGLDGVFAAEAVGYSPSKVDRQRGESRGLFEGNDDDDGWSAKKDEGWRGDRVATDGRTSGMGLDGGDADAPGFRVFSRVDSRKSRDGGVSTSSSSSDGEEDGGHLGYGHMGDEDGEGEGAGGSGMFKVRPGRASADMDEMPNMMLTPHGSTGVGGGGAMGMGNSDRGGSSAVGGRRGLGMAGEEGEEEGERKEDPWGLYSGVAAEDNSASFVTPGGAAGAGGRSGGVAGGSGTEAGASTSLLFESFLDRAESAHSATFEGALPEGGASRLDDTREEVDYTFNRMEPSWSPEGTGVAGEGGAKFSEFESFDDSDVFGGGGHAAGEAAMPGAAEAAAATAAGSKTRSPVPAPVDASFGSTAWDSFNVAEDKDEDDVGLAGAATKSPAAGGAPGWTSLDAADDEDVAGGGVPVSPGELPGDEYSALAVGEDPFRAPWKGAASREGGFGDDDPFGADAFGAKDAGSPEEGATGGAAQAPLGSQLGHGGEAETHDGGEGLVMFPPGTEGEVLFSFSGTHEGEVSVDAGERVTLISHEQGWYEVSKKLENGEIVVGVVPRSYVQALAEDLT
eukprot:jgi/Mesvir1/16905/Mv15774-RA.1